jgi:DNA-binding SARP family transcriptional activator
VRGRGHPGWRALEAYRRPRDILVEELGLEPSSRLRRLHQAILSGEGPEQYTGPLAARRGKPAEQGLLHQRTAALFAPPGPLPTH